MKTNSIRNKKKLIYFNNSIIKKFKDLADLSKKKRSRICIHTSQNCKTHEMIIFLKKNSYIRPHIHPNQKSESYHVIKGKMLVYVFTKSGKTIDVIKMSSPQNSDNFYYRMNKGYYHMPIAISDYCVYHETFSGPFEKQNDVTYAEFAPPENDQYLIKKFLKQINHKY